MLHYIAFAWNTKVPGTLGRSLGRRVNALSADWRCALDTEGLQVYQLGSTVRASQAYQLDRDSGVVLGKVFARHGPLNCKLSEVTFNERETEKVRQSEGRHLVEHYWGRYVALLKPKNGTGVKVLRDPTGAMPCFITRFRGIDVVCSHIQDSTTLGLITCSINWSHVAAYLSSHHMVTSDTGLEGVRQVRAGECVSVGGNSTGATFYWSPHCIHERRRVEDRQHAMRELRDAIQHCVGSWASCYSNVLHELSGGLDSAVVLACLSRAPHALNIVCENKFTQDKQGDERAFARRAAKSAKVELIETPIQLSDRLLDQMFESTKVATPALTAFAPETQLKRQHIVNTRGIEAVFSGHGGDHFFQRVKTREIAAEYAWHHGLRGEIFGIILDTSRFTRKSVWSVVAAVITSGLLRRHRDPYKNATTPSPLISDFARDAIDPDCIRHPWVDAAVDVPASKRRQIFDILDSQSFYGVPSQNLDIVYPLMSQPIIELCLQIPSYVLTYGGIDRALVRQAFEGLVPPDIIARTRKGATTGYFNDLLVWNLPLLREFLLDGLLVAEGLLDKRKTAVALSEPSLIRDSTLLLPILVAVRAEFWLRTWICVNQRAAA